MSTNGKSTKKTKPEKPYPEFPLFAHPNGQWAKKVKGHPYYFGGWGDPDAALDDYHRRIAGIRAGRDPKVFESEQAPGSITVADVVNLYLESQEARVNRGEITRMHFTECIQSCKRLIDHFGRSVSAAGLRASDFSRYRASFPDTWGTCSVGLQVARIRAVFRWAAETEIIPALPNFGPSFKKPGVREKRKEKAKRQAHHGRLDFSAEEVRKLLDETTGWMRACILLGVNAGFGNRDCSTLRINHVDSKDGWFELRRQKTGIPRRAFLWSETRDAISAAVASRRSPTNDRDDALCFLTRTGAPLVNECRSKSGTVSVSDNVSTAFSKLLKRLDMKTPGKNFYSLRRTFETVAGATRDQVAVDLIMGHVDDSMAAVYRQGIDDQRLIDVAEHVRQWLFGGT